MRSVPPKMMLGFVVRQCAVELGHTPNAAELAEWANERRAYRVFGRSISVEEARVILRSPERMVTIHPDWEAQSPALHTNAEPAKVIALRPASRSR